MTRLYLDETELSGDAWRLLGRYISTNDHLTQLIIYSSAAHRTSESLLLLFDGLRESRSLTVLTINIRLSEQAVQSMVPFLMNAPKLNKLAINLGSESLRTIVRTLDGSSIEQLMLDRGDLGDASAIGSCKMPNLKFLELQKSGMSSVPPLHGFPQLNSLSLFGNKIDKEGFARLNEYLGCDSCPLRTLGLGYTGMTDEDILSLTQALKHNSSVRDLYLGGNDCGEAGYRSILKMVVDISSIKATIESNTCLHEIELPKENDDRYESDSDSDASEYNSRDGFEEIRDQIHDFIVLNCHSRPLSLKERVMRTQLNTKNRRQLSGMQGVDYSYGSLFTEIPACILPDLFAILWKDPKTMDPFRALVATVTDWTSLVDRRLMVESTLKRNRALIKQLAERNLELEGKLKDIELSRSDNVLSGSKRTHGQLM